MAGTYTLPGVLLSGLHSARPAASAVADGTLYAETDTAQTYQSDGVSTWTAWGASAGGSLEVKEVDGSPDVTGVTKIIVSNGSLTDNTGGSVSIVTGGGGGGGVTTA